MNVLKHASGTATFDFRKSGYVVKFDAPPAIGSSVVNWGGHVVTLVAVDPYTRKDGSQSFILTWKGKGGFECSSGLKGKAMNRPASRPSIEQAILSGGDE